MLGEAYLELERACPASKIALYDRGGREVEDLKWPDAELEEAVHCLFVVSAHDAYFGDGTEEGAAESSHGCMPYVGCLR